MVQTQRKTEHNGSSDGVILFELVVQTNHLRRRWFQVLGSLLCPAGLSFSPEIDSSLLSYVSQSASERSFLFCGEKVRCPVLICTLLLFVCTLERCTVYWLELCRPSHLFALQSSALLASHLHCGLPPRLVSGTVQLVVEGSTQELAIRGQLGFEAPLLSLLLVMHWSLKGKTESLIVYIFQ